MTGIRNLFTKYNIDYSRKLLSSNIDIAVFWTNTVENNVGGRNQILSIVASAYTLLNDVMIDNKIPLTFTIKYNNLINFAETTMKQDLKSFYLGTNGLKYTHYIRNKYKVDLMQLIVDNAEYCGYGYILKDKDTVSWRDYGLSLVHYNCLSYYSHIHEIGHNLGLNHNIEDATFGYKNYGFGYRYCDNSVKIRTIMSYNCPTTPSYRIPYFSSPDILYNGIPTGTRNANNRKVILKTKNLVSNFR